MNNMSNHLLKRFMALVLVFAMVLSLAATAFAADMSEEPFEADTSDSSVVAVAEEETEEPETVVEDDTAAEEVVEEEVPAEPETEVEGEAEEEAEEPAEEPAEEEAADEAEEAEQTEEETGDLTEAGEILVGWNYDSVAKAYYYGYEYHDPATGEVTVKKCVDENIDGIMNMFHTAYQLPASVGAVNGAQIKAGVYYFDVNGNCMLPSKVTLTSEKCNDPDKKMKDCTAYNVYLYDDVTEAFSEEPEARCVKFAIATGEKLGRGEFFNGGFVGEDNRIYFGEADGVVKTDTTTSIAHWCGEKFYLYTTTVKKYTRKYYDNPQNKETVQYAIGTAYTGSHKFGSLPENEIAKKMVAKQIYFFQDGVLQEQIDGSFHWWHSSNSYSGTDLVLLSFGNSATYGMSTGKLFTGTKKIGSLPAEIKTKYDVGYVYYFSAGLPTKCDSSVHWYDTASTTNRYRMYVFKDSAAHKGYSVGTPYTGVRNLAASGIPAAMKGIYTAGLQQYTNGVPKPYTGIYKVSGAKGYEYYKDGVKAKYTGWQKSGSKYYYFDNSTLAFNSGAAAAANKYCKGIGATSKTYRYTFKTDGSVVTNLFSYNSAYKAKKMRIQVDNTYHNTIFLIYDSGNSSYDIAGLQVICSTPHDVYRKRGEALVFGKYFLSTTRRWSWVRNNKQSRAYCMCTEIVKWNSATSKYVTSGYMFHSPQFYEDAYTLGKSSSAAKQKKAYHRLVTGNYNKFGGSNTGGCVRLQVGYCALVQSISSNNKKGNVQVWYNTYSDKGPFGLVKNADIQIPSSQNYDPTTPASKL